MKIRIGDWSRRIDFTIPIQSTEEQLKKLEKFFKTIYDESVVDTEYLSEDAKFRTKRLGDKPGPMYPAWDIAENTLLLDFEKTDEKEIAEAIGRTETAVYMHRGQWIAKFMEWAGNKNIYKDSEKLVKEFMKYIEEEKIKKRKTRKIKNKKQKDLEKDLKSKTKTLEIQKDMMKRMPSMKEKYEKAMKKTESDIKKIKDELDQL